MLFFLEIHRVFVIINCTRLLLWMKCKGSNNGYNMGPLKSKYILEAADRRQGPYSTNTFVLYLEVERIMKVTPLKDTVYFLFASDVVMPLFQPICDCRVNHYWLDSRERASFKEA